tara:strand:- start:460 stop:1449 length:990 start_codon:yes stop_codon:yes gene_type:complete
MIIKSFEFKKVESQSITNYLFYGENDGFKNEIIKENFKSKTEGRKFYYEESEVLKNKDIFFENLLTQSFFENQKLVIISRATDKITNIAEEIIERKIQDLVVIFVSGKLEKKSKLRNLFEKNKEAACVPFYQDNNQTLLIITQKFFRNIKIPVSQEILNVIIEKSNGNRENLQNELEKIESYCKNKEKIELKEIIKLTNLSENNDISELVNYCLAKNQKKILRILNDNNFSNEDTILIIRIFLSKVKRLVILKNKVEFNKNIDSVISSYKPAIFWKEKDIIKQQIKNWTKDNINNLLYNINEVELLIKKNYEHSIKTLLNFILTTGRIN